MTASAVVENGCKRAEPSSGFNHTQHNCNTEANRPKKRNCGCYTLIGSVDGAYQHHRFRCKSYTCGRCGPRKIRQVRKRIVTLATEHGLQRFLTLTLDPKKIPADVDLKGKIQYLQAIWRKMRVYLSRRLGRSLLFIAVLELQTSGNPHLHLLVGSFLPKQWVSMAWQSLGGGWSTRIEYADVHRVARYLSKYLTDESTLNLPSGTRRFSTSQGLRLFDRSPGKGTWILIKLPINLCHELSARITMEIFESEQDGARNLVSFVSERTSPFLAERLSNPEGPRLSLEVSRRKTVVPR